MTAAILRHESFVELPSRRLRQESERLLAPALLVAALLVAALLIACGAIPTSPLQILTIPVPERGIVILPDWQPPPGGAVQQPHVAPAPDLGRGWSCIALTNRSVGGRLRLGSWLGLHP